MAAEQVAFAQVHGGCPALALDPEGVRRSRADQPAGDSKLPDPGRALEHFLHLPRLRRCIGVGLRGGDQPVAGLEVLEMTALACNLKAWLALQLSEQPGPTASHPKADHPDDGIQDVHQCVRAANVSDHPQAGV